MLKAFYSVIYDSIFYQVSDENKNQRLKMKLKKFPVISYDSYSLFIQKI